MGQIPPRPLAADEDEMRVDANYLLTEKILRYRYPPEISAAGAKSAEVMFGFGHLLLDRQFATRHPKAALGALAGPECLGRAD